MKTDYSARWKTGDGLSAHVRILRAIQSKEFDEGLMPFGKIGVYIDMRGFPVGSLRGIAGCQFQNVDFTQADFASVRIENCAFTNVRFERANLSGLNDWGNRFERCEFQETLFKRAIVGGQGTQFSDCLFDHCDFRGASFVRPEIDRCRFAFCDLKGVDFNGASFVETTFVGEVRDVWFRGGFAYPTEVKSFGIPRKNSMSRVSFAEAELRWVTFSHDCDLSTVTPPADGNHRLYDHWRARIGAAQSAAQNWDEDERIVALNYLRTFQVHAETQDWYILGAQEVLDELGENTGAKLLHALGA